jgi:ubiquinone/menaquinone biosynthesis C-methylase UbiE
VKGSAIDLCCGPGHFTILLAKYFDLERVVGIDLSERMIDQAKQNAEAEGVQDRVQFKVANAMSCGESEGSFDIVSCNDAAHHMPDLEGVTDLLRAMERLASPTGVCILSDLVRLKTEALTDKYTKVIGKGYPKHFYNDFCNSMRAAWLPEQLSAAIPDQSERHWIHECQRLLPTVQFVYGTPLDGQGVFVRRGTPWSHSTNPIPPAMRIDFRMFEQLFCCS